MKEGWEIKKLPEVVWFQEGPGVRKHQYTTQGIKLLNVANLVNGKVDLSTSDRYISEDEAYGKYNHFLADEGDLILASSGIQVETIDKKMGFITKDHLPLCMNTSTIRFKTLDENTFLIKFFMYFLKSLNFKDQLFRLITGIAQLNFGPSHLKQMSIPVPPLPTQERIVSELDCINSIIEKKREQLKELDALAQSIFYDMFGDPIHNEMGWEVRKLGEVAEISSGGTPSRKIQEYFTGDINWYSAGELNSLYLPDSIEQITEDAIKESAAKLFKCNTLMVGMYDTAAFKLGILKKDSASNQACANINLYTDNVVWMYYLLTFMKEEALKHRHGARQKNLNVGFIKSFEVPLPPLSLQQSFASKIEAIEKQKELIKRSIAETETLLASRMQYYFG